MNRFIAADATSCIGCHACEVACVAVCPTAALSMTEEQRAIATAALLSL
jgi:Fe-S-cluster-containing hydrogenase component 2